MMLSLPAAAVPCTGPWQPGGAATEAIQLCVEQGDPASHEGNILLWRVAELISLSRELKSALN